MLTKETMDNIEFDIRLLTTEYLDGTVWPIFETSIDIFLYV